MRRGGREYAGGKCIVAGVRGTPLVRGLATAATVSLEGQIARHTNCGLRPASPE